MPEGAIARRRPDRQAWDHARRYGDALRAADAAAAERVVDDALAAGMAPQAIQSLVIAPAMVRIGELWAADVLTVADEHLATAISQRVLVRLFDRLNVARTRSRERILLAAPQGQSHVLGLRMIADVLEGAGFDVHYLGADVPCDALARFAVAHQPAVTGLAAGTFGGDDLLADALQEIHRACPATRIMLGGRAVPASLVAAGYPLVSTSMGVVATVERLLGEPAMRPPAILEDLRRPGVREPRRAAERDTIAGRLAEVAEETAETARMYVRRAGEFRDLAFRDHITDLANRRAFDDRIGALAGHGGALLMIDVDRFKAVNDGFGHDAGDRLLGLVGGAIARAIRGQDFAARVGGDEFAVLLPGTEPDDARDVAERIRRAVADDADPPVTVSIGLAVFAADTRGAVLAADKALYAAKSAGRDQLIDARGR